MHRVFVYGTLKQGYGNHDFYLSKSLFLGHAATVERFRMIQAGFPVLRGDTPIGPHPLFASVAGEVYLVDDATLRELDGLEGEGSMYDRKKVMVRMPFMPDPGMDFMVRREVSIYIGCASFWDTGPRVRYQHHIQPNVDCELSWSRIAPITFFDGAGDDEDEDEDDVIADAVFNHDRKGW